MSPERKLSFKLEPTPHLLDFGGSTAERIVEDFKVSRSCGGCEVVGVADDPVRRPTDPAVGRSCGIPSGARRLSRTAKASPRHPP